MYSDTKMGWLDTMINRLEDGMYWHIPKSNDLLRIDKKRKQFIVIKGRKRSSELELLKRELEKFGYSLRYKNSEGGYFTA